MSGERQNAASSRHGSVPGVASVLGLGFASGRAPAVTAAPSVEVWGVLNVTPDSFSDGGRFVDPARAVEHGRRMAAEGADVIDVGGASSRPPGTTYGAGAPPVDEAEEIRRTEPVVRALAASGVRVSIDTTRAAVARAALGAGAAVVNDVSMGSEPALLAAVAEAGAELVLMHNRGDGRVEGPRPDDVVGTVRAELAGAVRRATELGVRDEKIWLDPGIGFAKTAAESATVLARLSELTAGHRVLVGASRKSFLAALTPEPDGSLPPPAERLGASVAAVTLAVLAGARAVRVHDVRASRQAAMVALAMKGGARG